MSEATEKAKEQLGDLADLFHGWHAPMTDEEKLIASNAAVRLVDEALESLESQNQALQEELEVIASYRPDVLMRLREERCGWQATAQANIAMVTEHQQAIAALQERAEKAEADARRWRMGVEEIASWEDEAPIRGEREFARLILAARPTQETDPE